MAGSGSETTRTSHTVASIPSVSSSRAADSAAVEHLPHRQYADRTVTGPGATSVHARARPHPVGTHGAGVLGKRMIEGPSRVRAWASMTSTSGADEGAKTRHARYGQGEHHVQQAVMTGAVVAGDAGAVEDDHHRQAVKSDVEVGLVEGAAEEGRIDRHHRPHAGHGHPGRGGDRVLLGDAHVDESLGEPGLEGQQTGRTGHGRGDGHDPGVLLGLA